MRTCISLTFLLLLFPGICVAQKNDITVYGYVTDSVSGEYLQEVQVISGTIGTVTNKYGYYSLQLSKGNHTLEYRYVGYRTVKKELKLTKSDRIDIIMSPGLSLKEITVSPEAKSQLFTEKGMGEYSVITAKMEPLPSFAGESDIMKTFQLLPGISGGAEGSSDVVIRGGGNDQNLLLLDQVPVYNQNHAFGLVSVFNNAALKKADIYKGGIPPVYGGRLSGVSSLWMKEGNMKEHRQTLKLGTIAAGLLLEGPVIKDKSSYLISVRRSFLDLIYQGIMALDNNPGAIPGFSFLDVNAKVNYKLNQNNHLFWSIYTGRDRFSMKMKEDNEKGKFYFGWGNLTSSIRWNSILSRRLFSNITFYFSNMDNKQENQIETNDIKNIQQNISRTNEFGGKISFDYTIGENQKLNFGIQLSLQNFYPVIQYIKNDEENSYTKGLGFSLLSIAPYIEDKISFGAIQINPGMRLIYFNNENMTYIRWEPRFRITYKSFSGHTFMAGLTVMNQPIYQVYNTNYGWPVDYWLPFLSENKPSHSWQASVGWQYNISPGLDLTLESYYKKMRDMIYVDEPVKDYLGSGDFQHPDIASGYAYGLEMLLKFNKNRFDGWISYTYSRSYRQFIDQSGYFPFRYDRPHDLGAVANYKLGNSEKSVKYFSGILAFRSGVPYKVATHYLLGQTPPLIPNGYFEDFNSIEYYPKTPNIRIKNYFRMDLSFSTKKKIKNGNRIWQFSILNVTNTKNPYIIYRDNNDMRMKQLVLFPIMPAISYTRKF